MKLTKVKWVSRKDRVLKFRANNPEKAKVQNVESPRKFRKNLKETKEAAKRDKF